MGPDLSQLEALAKAAEAFNSPVSKPLNGGCNLRPAVDAPGDKEPVLKLTEDEKEELEAKKLGLTVTKLRAMKDYARTLRMQDRKMKMSTIKKKVAQKFNIKIV